MKWQRRFLTFGVTLALLAGVSCSTGEGPFEPSTTQPSVQPIDQPSHLLGGLLGGVGGLVGGTLNGVLNLAGGVLSELLEITGLLKCEEQRYDVTQKTIGPKGGTIKVGKHTLVIPKGALRKNVKIKAEQMRGKTNSVRLSPHGLEFEKPAVLILSYQNCKNVEVPKAIVYTTEKFEVREILKSLDLLRQRVITAPIDHFSRYAVAY